MDNGASARARSEGGPVAIANDRRTLRSTIAHRIGELDALEELLHLLIEGSTTNDHLIELATKGFEYLLTNLHANFLGDHRHGQQETHTVVLYLGEYLLADNLFDDKRYGNDDDGFDISESLSDNRWTRNTVQVVHMTAMQEFEDELESHTVHMSHRENRDDPVTWTNPLS